MSYGLLDKIWKLYYVKQEREQIYRNKLQEWVVKFLDLQSVLFLFLKSYCFFFGGGGVIEYTKMKYVPHLHLLFAMLMCPTFFVSYKCVNSKTELDISVLCYSIFPVFSWTKIHNTIENSIFLYMFQWNACDVILHQWIFYILISFIWTIQTNMRYLCYLLYTTIYE